MDLKDKIIEKFYGEPKPKEWDDDYDPLGNVKITDMKKLMDEYGNKLCKGLKIIEENAWDLRCESYPLADTGDYSVQWVIYEHYKFKESKPIGYGSTPIEAIIDAEVQIHGEVS